MGARSSKVSGGRAPPLEGRLGRLSGASRRGGRWSIAGRACRRRRRQSQREGGLGSAASRAVARPARLHCTLHADAGCWSGHVARRIVRASVRASSGDAHYVACGWRRLRRMAGAAAEQLRADPSSVQCAFAMQRSTRQKRRRGWVCLPSCCQCSRRATPVCCNRRAGM